MNLRINDNSAYIAIILDNRAELIMLIFLVW